MKNITLKIKGSYVYDEAHEEDQIELITEGKMYVKGDVIYLTYDESQLSGMDGCKTRLKLDGDSVSMTRKRSAVSICIFDIRLASRTKITRGIFRYRFVG